MTINAEACIGAIRIEIQKDNTRRFRGGLHYMTSTILLNVLTPYSTVSNSYALFVRNVGVCILFFTPNPPILCVRHIWKPLVL